MKKQALQHHRYPKSLMSLQHLEGGIYGTFALVARDPDTLEIRLGADFVRVTPDVASQIAESCARFAGAPPVEILVEEVDEIDEEEEIVEERAPVARLARPRRVARRRAGI